MHSDIFQMKMENMTWHEGHKAMTNWLITEAYTELKYFSQNCYNTYRREWFIIIIVFVCLMGQLPQRDKLSQWIPFVPGETPCNIQNSYSFSYIIYSVCFSVSRKESFCSNVISFHWDCLLNIAWIGIVVIQTIWECKINSWETNWTNLKIQKHTSVLLLACSLADPPDFIRNWAIVISEAKCKLFIGRLETL